MAKKSKKQKPKTYVAIILDKSGSMSSCRESAVKDYNEQIQQMKENSKDQEILGCLVTFNGAVFEHVWLEKAENLEEATTESYVPNGGTAMRDGIGYTIKKLQDTVTDKDNENVAFLVIVISDGAENASNHYDVSTLRNMINACQETKRWTFTYMGCSEAYLKEVSRETGIPISNMAVWDSSNNAASATGFSHKLCRSANYYGSRSKGLVAADCFYSDIQGQCADFTGKADLNNNVDLNSIISSGGPDLNNVAINSASPTQYDWNSVQNLNAKVQSFSNVNQNQVRSSIAEQQIGSAVFKNGTEVKWS